MTSILSALERWQRDPAVQAAVADFYNSAAIIETTVAIQQIPAPTFEEQRRAVYVEEQMRALGLAHIDIDAAGNVYGCRPGQKQGPALLISAHLDTIFPASTDLTVRRQGQRIYGPGIGDNSLGTAALLHLAKAFQHHNLANDHDIWFVANVGEEGLGDLCGMRAAITRLRDAIGVAIVIEGSGHDRIIHEAIGVRRYRISVTTPGGHSWQNFGAPSAIHTLVRLAEQLTRLDLPKLRSSFNIGVIEGGSSVNTIAERATLLLDLRSINTSALNNLVQQVEQIIEAARAAEPRVQIQIDTVGDRPAGRIPRDHPLVQMTTTAYKLAGSSVSYGVGSTDANVPLSLGIPAVCIGIGDGENAHRLDEFIEPTRIPIGMCALLLMALTASSTAFSIRSGSN
jgi:acetylornithine deacetylase/succinyl-diaminopimelate desuccinylase-like protein